MVNKSGTSPQAVALPSGGADIRGLGETFQPDLNSGTGNYRVPIDLPPGIVNFQPTLALTYSTGAGNSAYGLGWNLPIAAIGRRTDRGCPTYDRRDAFLYGASELIEVEPGRYRAGLEHTFERFVRLADGWQVTEKAGIHHTLGTTTESRIEFVDGQGEKRVFAWLIERSEDANGNAVTYHYLQRGPQRYLAEVRYAVYSIRFDYEDRPDPYSEFRSGFELRTDLRCSRIALHVQPAGPDAVKNWQLSYRQADLSQLSLLTAVTHTGHDPETGEVGGLPPLEFSYTDFDPQQRRFGRFSSEVDAPPPGLDRPDFELLNMDGTALPGVLGIENGVPRYWPNRGGLRWGPPRTLRQFPAAFSLGEDRIRFADMDGNGAADVLVGTGTLSGYYENSGGGDWDAFVQYGRSPSFDFQEQDIQLFDVNGDGRIDAVRSGRTGLQVYENLGPAGWREPRLVTTGDAASSPPDLTARDLRVRLADLNGDGLLDVVMVSSGRTEYWPARGNARFAPGRMMSGSPRFPYPFDPARLFVTDVNGDGLADIVYVGFDEVTYWINQSGNAFSAPQTIRYTPPTTRTEALRVADMTGNGTGGLLWTGPFPDYRYLDFIGTVKPGLLRRIDNNLGRVTTIEYTTSTEQAMADRREGQPWTSFLPFPVQVVSSVELHDAASGLHSVSRYRYHEGNYDGQRREFDGFGRAEQIDEGDASMPTALTRYHYHTAASVHAVVTDPDLQRTLKRKLYRVELYDDSSTANTNAFRVEESEWDVRLEQTLPDGQRILFPHVTRTTNSTFERGANPRVEHRTYVFDQFGNVVTEVRGGEGDGAAPLFLSTTVEYASNVDAWIVDRPARIVQRDSVGRLLGEIRHYYDGTAFVGLDLGQITRGRLSRVERIAARAADVSAIYGADTLDFLALGYVAGQDADGEPTFNVNHERRETDARGNVTAVQDALGNTTHYAFDGFGLFAVRTTDAKGFVATVEHDYRAAKPRRMVNPNGGVTEARYDPLGRIASVAFPGDDLALPSCTYVYDTSISPSLRRTEYRATAGGGQMVRIAEYLDGAGAVVQRRTQHESNLFSVSGRIVINSRGKTAAQLEPFFAAGIDFQPYVDDPAAPSRTLQYDALGRPVATTNPDGGRSRAEYSAFSASFSDPGDTDVTSPISFNTPRVELYDAWQRLIGVEEHDAVTTKTTSYRLDPLGRLQQVTDARGAVLTKITYDLLGRRVAIDHLDAGRRLTGYDAAGNTVLSVDAAGDSITRTYDELRRLATTTYRGEVQEHYEYDVGPGANPIGHLVRAADPSGETTFDYDSRGNVTGRAKTTAGQPGDLSLRYGQDRLGRITSVTYPDNVTIDFDYGEGLLLRQIPGYIDDIEYTAAGVRTALVYANGVRTEYGYNPATLRLDEIKIWNPHSGDVFLNTRYTTSKAGNISSIADLRPGAPGLDRSQQLGYDAFDQLIHAEGNNAVGGYVHDYGYDATGNVLRSPLLSPLPLVYDGTTDRLLGFDDGGVTVSAFGHDANGNMTTLPGRTLSFDPKQQLERVQLSAGADVRFRYDHRGVLSVRTLNGPAGQSTSLFFDSVYEVHDGDPVRWVFAGQFPVAREEGGAKVFLHNDHLGSAVIYSDEEGNLLSEAAYYPFGGLALAPAAGALPSFTTKQLDADLGLYYFNARWYAPDIGRFISPDPLYLFHPEQGIQEPRRLNPYAYAGNNPVRFVDPTGLGFWDVLGAIVVVVAVIVAVVAVAILTAGVGLAIGFGTLALYAGAAGLAGAAVGAIVGGIAYGSWEGALRGALIGFTAGANALIGGMIFGPIIGAALGITTFLAIIPPVARSDYYQGVLGWTSYIMPMSWPGHAIGLALFALNVGGYLVTFGQVDELKIHDIKVDWKTGTIATLGGWTSRVMTGAIGTSIDAATVGGFSFFDYDTSKGRTSITDDLLDHEAGHMLNNAAFGWFQVFNIFGGGHDDKYFEKLAESNAPSSRGKPRIDQWG